MNTRQIPPHSDVSPNTLRGRPLHTLVFGDGESLQGEKFIVCAGGHARRSPCRVASMP